MATLEELRDWVLKTVNDTDVTSDEVDLLLNEALVEVSMLVLLPELSTWVAIPTITTDIKVPLPDDFQRNLYAASTEYGSARVLSSIELFLRRYPTAEIDKNFGYIESVCRDGENVFYYKVPETISDLVVYYYKSPTALTRDSHTPDCIPTNYQRNLLCSYASRELFDDIEDGIDGQKVNTSRHAAKFAETIGLLEATTKQGQSRPQPGRDRNSWV